MSDKISVLIDEKKVDQSIEEIGKAISEAYEGKCVHMVCVLKGRVVCFLPVSWQRESLSRCLWISCRFPVTEMLQPAQESSGLRRIWMTPWRGKRF